ncbi:unnamed protein product [Candida verbasci]|uniref:Serine aminopeptidase S33 domain-containing protein n=1 Tax=Candida verbasci TaxID=1227364 RepID=A0A9W4TW13_9ASCO|nr:unnamed protein product [Candida verbasci]
MGNPEVPIPYTPTNSPIEEWVEYNGANFKTVTWKVPSDKKYKGKIIYVHGFAENSKVYTEYFDNISLLGYEVFFFDQRGAGETSPGKLIGETNEKFVFDDLDFFIKRNLDARTNENEKFFLMGHSMGGGIVLNYGIRGKYLKNFKGIVACGPLIELHPKTKPNFLLRWALPQAAKFIPNFKFDSGLNYDFITSNERWKQYIMKHDQKLIGTFGQYDDMFKRGFELLKPEYVAKFDKDISVLIVHGTTDFINDSKGSEKFFNLLPNDVDKQFELIKEGRHSLFNENDELFKIVLKYVVDFLDLKVKEETTSA